MENSIHLLSSILSDSKERTEFTINQINSNSNKNPLLDLDNSNIWDDSKDLNVLLTDFQSQIKLLIHHNVKMNLLFSSNLKNKKDYKTNLTKNNELNSITEELDQIINVLSNIYNKFLMFTSNIILISDLHKAYYEILDNFSSFLKSIVENKYTEMNHFTNLLEENKNNFIKKFSNISSKNIYSKSIIFYCNNIQEILQEFEGYIQEFEENQNKDDDRKKIENLVEDEELYDPLDFEEREYLPQEAEIVKNAVLLIKSTLDLIKASSATLLRINDTKTTDITESSINLQTWCTQLDTICNNLSSITVNFGSELYPPVSNHTTEFETYLGQFHDEFLNLCEFLKTKGPWETSLESNPPRYERVIELNNKFNEIYTLLK